MDGMVGWGGGGGSEITTSSMNVLLEQRVYGVDGAAVEQWTINSSHQSLVRSVQGKERMGNSNSDGAWHAWHAWHAKNSTRASEDRLDRQDRAHGGRTDEVAIGSWPRSNQRKTPV